MTKLTNLFLGFCLAFCLAQNVFSATYTVTKIADTNDGTCDAADCSLREAIAAANATADNDTIEFSAAVFNAAQTIVLSGTDLIITNNGTLTINGTGANLLTVSGNNQSRVFTNNTAAVTNINNLRATGGNGVSTVTSGRAGAIYNNGGNLTLNNLIVTGNTAANGGGLNNAGTGAVLTLINCTVSNNSATGAGGGIQNFSGSALNLLSTTISANTSGSTFTGGGGILGNGTITITNSTISGNSAINDGGAMYYNGQGLTVNNSTFANNTANSDTGGLYKSISTNNANLRNTIVANNTGGASPDVAGIINSLGNNLIGTVGTSTGWQSTDLLNQNPLLGPLANNGGPTQTHALLPGSPAINAGQNCVINASCTAGNPPAPLTTDQRGQPRQIGTAVDIGAFEFNPAAVISRTAFDFDGDGRTDYGVFRPSNSTWYLQQSTAGLLAVQFGVASDRLTPADFDGDGKTDIAVWRENTGDPERAFFYILQSQSNTVQIQQFGRTGDDPRIVGDWDGDGKADPAVYRNAASGGQSLFFYRPSAQPGVDFVVVYLGTAGDEPVRGDFDGDGKLDAAVFRPSDNVWYIRQSSNSQLRYASWGVASDKRVPADYDGDGKTDLAVYRGGLWVILQSSNNQPIYQNWGLATDRPTPGDYDGDGKTDLAVYRDNTFYVLRSNGNQFAAVQFGLSGDVPVASAYTP